MIIINSFGSFVGSNLIDKENGFQLSGKVCLRDREINTEREKKNFEDNKLFVKWEVSEVSRIL